MPNVNLTYKRTLRQVFYLYEAPSPPMTPYCTPTPLTHCLCVYSLFIHTGKGGRCGELTREKIRGAIVHKAGRKYQHDWLYLQSINSIKRHVKTTFRVCCLYGYLVHASTYISEQFKRGFTEGGGGGGRQTVPYWGQFLLLVFKRGDSCLIASLSLSLGGSPPPLPLSDPFFSICKTGSHIFYPPYFNSV